MNLMPIVFIPEPVYKEIMLSARVAKGEISWIGEVMLCPGGGFDLRGLFDRTKDYSKQDETGG